MVISLARPLSMECGYGVIPGGSAMLLFLCNKFCDCFRPFNFIHKVKTAVWGFLYLKCNSYHFILELPVVSSTHKLHAFCLSV